MGGCVQSAAVQQNREIKLGDDLLEGADAIAAFLFGASEDEKIQKRNRRKVYYLATCTRLPTFRLGAMLCARKSVPLQFITDQEAGCFRRLTKVEPSLV
jgi:hypothetical protein